MKYMFRLFLPGYLKAQLTLRTLPMLIWQIVCIYQLPQTPHTFGLSARQQLE